LERAEREWRAIVQAAIGQLGAEGLVAAELFLPRAWADDRKRRREVEVPPEVTYRSQPRIAREMLTRLAPKVPFPWVLGDEEFGRARAFRDEVRALSKNYLVEVPRNTQVRRVRKGTTRTLERKQWAVEKLRRTIPVSDWAYFQVRDGEKGPIEVRATMMPVATEREGQPWVRKMLVLIETLDGSDRWYCLAHAPAVAALPDRRLPAGTALARPVCAEPFARARPARGHRLRAGAPLRLVLGPHPHAGRFSRRRLRRLVPRSALNG
jgi:SRSO17 transposase